MKKNNILNWMILITWLVVGLLLIGKEVPKITFYCCLVCLILGKIEQIILR